MIMLESKYFSIDIGSSEDGIYCSYCGALLTPKKDDDTGAYYFQCTCAQAYEELEFQRLIEDAGERLSELEERIDKTIELQKRMLAHTSCIKALDAQRQEIFRASQE